MRYIRRFQENGTLLFVSHDTSAVQGLCKSAIWLDAGRIVRSGISREIAEAYLYYTQQQIYGDRARIQSIEHLSPPAETAETRPYIEYGGEHQILDNLTEARGWQSGSAEIVSIEAHNLDTGKATFIGWDRVRLVIKARVHECIQQPILGFIVKDRLGQDIFGENTLPVRDSMVERAETGQIVTAEFVFRLPMLQNGEYAVMASVADGNLQDNVQHHYLHNACILNVSSSRVRWGLVGANFEHIEQSITDD